MCILKHHRKIMCMNPYWLSLTNQGRVRETIQSVCISVLVRRDDWRVTGFLQWYEIENLKIL